MRKERKHFTPEEKVALLRRHLVDKVPVSELCEELEPAGRYRRLRFMLLDAKSMRETDVEVIRQRARQKYLEAKPPIISDTGPQLISVCARRWDQVL